MGNEDIIKNFIVKEIISDNDKTNLGFEDSLIEAGVIDSLGIQKLILFLENEFAIKVNDDDVLPENFENIGAISSFISGKKK